MSASSFTMFHFVTKPHIEVVAQFLVTLHVNFARRNSEYLQGRSPVGPIQVQLYHVTTMLQSCCIPLLPTVDSDFFTKLRSPRHDSGNFRPRFCGWECTKLVVQPRPAADKKSSFLRSSWLLDFHGVKFGFEEIESSASRSLLIGS